MELKKALLSFLLLDFQNSYENIAFLNLHLNLSQDSQDVSNSYTLRSFIFSLVFNYYYIITLLDLINNYYHIK